VRLVFGSEATRENPFAWKRKKGFFASKLNRTNLKRNEREMKKNKQSKTKSVKRNDVKKICDVKLRGISYKFRLKRK